MRSYKCLQLIHGVASNIESAIIAAVTLTFFPYNADDLSAVLLSKAIYRGREKLYVNRTDYCRLHSN